MLFEKQKKESENTFVLDENFGQVIDTNRHNQLNYESLSGGQKARVNLSLLF